MQQEEGNIMALLGDSPGDKESSAIAEAGGTTEEKEG